MIILLVMDKKISIMRIILTIDHDNSKHVFVIVNGPWSYQKWLRDCQWATIISEMTINLSGYFHNIRNDIDIVDGPS